MAWIAYEPDRIVHLPSNTQITMRSYKIAWNDDNDKHSMVINYRFGDLVYNWEDENDRRRLKKDCTHHHYSGQYPPRWYRDFEDEKVRKRYLVILGRESEDPIIRAAMEARNKRVRERFEGWLEFDNLTTYFAITFSDVGDPRPNQLLRVGRRRNGRCKLLFISTDREEFETAKRGLQLRLGTVRFDELNGKPSGCKDGIYETFWDDVFYDD